MPFCFVFCGSRRFLDAQHIPWSSLLVDGFALRGMWFRTKTNRRGSSFGVITVGYLAPVDSPESSWTHVCKRLLDGAQSQTAEESGLGAAFAPDALFFHSSSSEGMIFAPHEHSFVLRWLRCFAARGALPKNTLHSCTATLFQ